jgi:ferredoxin-nitrite reductase
MKSTGISVIMSACTPQQQSGLSYVGLHVPVGRLSAQDMFDVARIADVYGEGEIRLTVEQNIIIPLHSRYAA